MPRNRSKKADQLGDEVDEDKTCENKIGDAADDLRNPTFT